MPFVLQPAVTFINDKIISDFHNILAYYFHKSTVTPKTCRICQSALFTTIHCCSQ